MEYKTAKEYTPAHFILLWGHLQLNLYYIYLCLHTYIHHPLVAFDLGKFCKWRK